MRKVVFYIETGYVNASRREVFEFEDDDTDEIIEETLSAVSSERTTRVIDTEEVGSMERRKREGYF
jgi:hypothetical protein